jgi:hypothetical protein
MICRCGGGEDPASWSHAGFAVVTNMVWSHVEVCDGERVVTLQSLAGTAGVATHSSAPAGSGSGRAGAQAWRRK